MLSASEFTTGSIGQAKPLALSLPRRASEETFLIGGTNERPVAIFLSGIHRFHAFNAADNNSWFGLLIPGVRIEVDEASVFDSRDASAGGAVIRLENRLVVRARGSGGELVMLEDALPPTLEGSVGFHHWQVVLGGGAERRVLYDVSMDEVQGGA